MKTSLKTLVTEPQLIDLAGQRCFERGRKYFAQGAVVRLKRKDSSLSARVQGTREYRVVISTERNDLTFSCDCPVGLTDEFCKHCVAVALAWLDKVAAGEDESANEAGDALRGRLLAQDKGKLVDLLLERAEEDELFAQRLHLMLSSKESKATVVLAFRKAIDKAIKRRRFVEYDEMFAYARGIEEVADSLEKLLSDGHHAEVRELAERALKATEQAMNSVDDSDGYMSGILRRFEQLHYDACQQLRPDPVALAEFLLTWELETDWDTFYDACTTYADVLGSEGVSAYKALAAQEMKEIQAASSIQKDTERFGRKFRIMGIMERFAEETGDVEALVAIKKQDLFGAPRFLEIADLYKKTGKRDAAIEWAKRGTKAFPEHAGGLNTFLIAEYHAAERHADAIALSWAKFADWHRLETYQSLKESADYLGEWPAWREKALRSLRESIAQKQRGLSPRWDFSFILGHSSLVEILLWEKRYEEAWEEAQLGGCRKDLWLELAAKRSKQHPADAVGVYLRFIEPSIQLANTPAYREAVEMLARVRELQTRLGQLEQFTALLNDIRGRHKLKRNLMSLLQLERW